MPSLLLLKWLSLRPSWLKQSTKTARAEPATTRLMHKPTGLEEPALALVHKTLIHCCCHRRVLLETPFLQLPEKLG